jgi:hypothetical protein
VLGHTAHTYQASRFAAAAGVYQPNDDGLRSDVLTLFMHGDECAVVSGDGWKGCRESVLHRMRACRRGQGDLLAKFVP